MTQQQYAQQPYGQAEDPFAPSAKRPSVSFRNAPVGTSFDLEVTAVPKMTQARDFDTREPKFWPDGNPAMTVATEVVDLATGEERTLWADKPSAMFRAIVEAQQAAGQAIAVGGRLKVTFTHETPIEGKPHLNPAKQYTVTYTPPAAGSTGDAFAQPVQQPVQPAAAAPVQQVTPAPAPPAAPPAAPAAGGGPSEAQVAALRAAGVDPATVFPGYSG